MVRRKLPAEIVAQTIRDQETFIRTLHGPELPTIDQAIKKAAADFDRHFAENIDPYLIRPEPPKKAGGGRPTQRDKVRAWIASRTQPGERLNQFIKRRARQEFGISRWTLARHLKEQN
jgi:hypothetical protein